MIKKKKKKKEEKRKKARAEERESLQRGQSGETSTCVSDSRRYHVDHDVNDDEKSIEAKEGRGDRLVNGENTERSVVW